jgi:hypothetical protein
VFLIHTRDRCMIKGDFARTSVPGNRRPWQILERHRIVPPDRRVSASSFLQELFEPRADESLPKFYVPRQLTPTGFRNLPLRLGARRRVVSRVPETPYLYKIDK